MLRSFVSTAFAGAFALCAAAGSAQQVFFGNRHSRTSISDGEGTPRDAYRHARDVARLDDFLVRWRTENVWRNAGDTGQLIDPSGTVVAETE